MHNATEDNVIQDFGAVELRLSHEIKTGVVLLWCHAGISKTLKHWSISDLGVFD